MSAHYIDMPIQCNYNCIFGENGVEQEVLAQLLINHIDKNKEFVRKMASYLSKWGYKETVKYIDGRLAKSVVLFDNDLAEEYYSEKWKYWTEMQKNGDEK